VGMQRKGIKTRAERKKNSVCTSHFVVRAHAAAAFLALPPGALRFLPPGRILSAFSSPFLCVVFFLDIRLTLIVSITALHCAAILYFRAYRLQYAAYNSKRVAAGVFHPLTPSRNDI